MKKLSIITLMISCLSLSCVNAQESNFLSEEITPTCTYIVGVLMTFLTLFFMVLTILLRRKLKKTIIEIKESADIEIKKNAGKEIIETCKENDFLKTLLNNIPIPIHIIDIETVTFTYVNNASNRIIGAKAGMPLWIQEQIDGIKKVGAEIDSIPTNGIISIKKEEIQLKDGTILETLAHKSLIEFEGRKQVLIVRINETEFVKNKNVLMTLSSTLPQIEAYFWDMDSRTRINYYNQLNLDVDLNSIKLVSDFFIYISDDDRERIAQECSVQLSQDNCTQHYIYKSDIKKRGEFEWWETIANLETKHDNNGVEYKTLYGIAFNVNEREKTREKYNNVAKQNELVLKNSNSIMVYLNKDYEVLWNNTEYALNEVRQDVYKLGAKCYSYFGYNEPCPNCPMKTAIETKKASSYEFAFNGGFFSTMANPVVSDNGEVENVVLRIENISQIMKQRSADEILSNSLPIMKSYAWYVDTRDNIQHIRSSLKLERDINALTNVQDFLNLVHKDDKNIVDLFHKFAQKDNASGTFLFRTDLEKIGEYEWWECYTTIETKTDGKSKYKLISGLTINVNEREKKNNKHKGLSLIHEMVLQNVNTGLLLLDLELNIMWSNLHERYGDIRGNKFNIGHKCYEGFGHNKLCDLCPIKDMWETGLPISYQDNKDPRFFLDSTYTPIFQDGKPFGIICKVENRKEHMDLINKLSNAKAKAEEADRTKSAFLANMSHEIRTPLNAIVGFSEIIVTENDPKEREMYGDIIANNGNLLLNLINDILDLSKIEAGLFTFSEEWFDLNELCTEIDSIFGMQTRDDVTLHYIEPKELVQIRMDKNRFRQALNNYLSNAIKYTPSGSIRFGYEVINNGIKVTVKDTGIGIAKDNQDKVFGRFNKFDDFAQGTGLGLAIVKAMTEQKGGEVGFDSEVGVGSTFWLWVPCEIKPLNFDKYLENIEPIKQIKQSGKLSILVVEDIDSNYQLLQAILRDYGLTRATNGKEAVNLCKNNHFSLIFMDIKMPEMNGLEATRAIREFNNYTPIIALTANAFYSDKNLAMEAGCNDFATKPVSKKVIFNILDKWQGNYKNS